MTIDLTYLRLRVSQPEIQDFGGVLTGALGGPAQVIDRAGTRYALTVTPPPMRYEPDGRMLAADLVAGRRDGVLIRVSQPDFDVGAPGAPVVGSDTASGRMVPIAGLTPGYAVRKGQWLSFVHAGHRYFDMARAQAVAAADGTAAILIQQPLRAALSAGDVVELGQPKIEGLIADFTSWTIDEKRMVQYQFRVAEAA